MPWTLDRIKARALSVSLSAPTALGPAITRLGFVQADPIRAPARAQDLILRHRVVGYRAGDLDHHFARLGIDEDFLYAYGFMPGATLRLIHPRRDLTRADGTHVPAGLAADVLSFVRERGAVHPRDLHAQFDGERVLDGWGAFSQATTRALKTLHYYGLLRVVRRQNGIRVYGVAPPYPESLSPDERMRLLVLLVTRILCPVSETTLRSTLHLLARGAPGLGRMHEAVQALLKSGELERAAIDSEYYLWPVGIRAGRAAETPPLVRFLSPFDPLVWDRRRFAHLWGWTYRFEAYTPAALRQFGYYAMPLLWRNEVIGWVNLTTPNGRLEFQVGYARSAPKGRDFRQAFDAELSRMEAFLART